MPPREQITSGSLSLIENGIKSFTISTGRFAASLHLGDSGGFDIPSKRAAGEHYSFTAQLAGDQTLHNGPADVDGHRYPLLWFAGTLQFTGKSLVLPADSAAAVSRSSRFKVAGDLQAFANNPFLGNPGPAVVDLNLYGQGIATVRFSRSMSDPLGGTGRFVRSLFYAIRVA